MKSDKAAKVILNDQDLIEWYAHQARRPISNKRRVEIAIIKVSNFIIEYFLRAVRLYSRGCQNSLDLQVRHVEFDFPGLPSGFHGLKILFLSDLHLGYVRDLPDVILEKLRGLEYDLCLFGGDYRFSFSQPYRPFLAELKSIVSQIHAPLGIYGVLGNHDELEFIPALENVGIRILQNTSLQINKGDQAIHLVGVDEIFAQRHDLSKAFEAVPQNIFSIFLGHSPDLYDEVEAHGAKLYLCGHTHYGQIHLPWIGPVVTLTSAPRKFAGGRWQHKKLKGYTSAGTGSSVHLVRFLCPPEVSIITLKKKP